MCVCMIVHLMPTLERCVIVHLWVCCVYVVYVSKALSFQLMLGKNPYISTLHYYYHCVLYMHRRTGSTRKTSAARVSSSRSDAGSGNVKILLVSSFVYSTQRVLRASKRNHLK